MGSIISKSGGDSKYHPETLEGYNVVLPGDIIINGLNLNYDLKSLRVGQVREKGVITSTYIAIRPKGVNSDFLKYLLKGFDFIKTFHGMGKGIRLTLSYGELKKMFIPVPSNIEQSRIASFLDAKCAEIDSILKKTQTSIEEYKALKQSVITEAVTKGIRGERPMKDSGVEWIGAIPADWKLVRLRFLSQIYTGNQDTQDNNPDGEFPFYVRSPFVERSNRWTFEGPAILMAGDGAGAGRVFHYVDGKYGCHQRVYSIQSIHGVSRRVLYYYLKELFYIMIETANSKSTVDSVRLDMLKDFPICIAPEEEQQEIAAYLDEKCAAIDSLIASKEALINELEAYQKSIIYEYVTGKKEVPES